MSTKEKFDPHRVSRSFFDGDTMQSQRQPQQSRARNELSNSESSSITTVERSAQSHAMPFRAIPESRKDMTDKSMNSTTSTSNKEGGKSFFECQADQGKKTDLKVHFSSPHHATGENLSRFPDFTTGPASARMADSATFASAATPLTNPVRSSRGPSETLESHGASRASMTIASHSTIECVMDSLLDDFASATKNFHGLALRLLGTYGKVRGADEERVSVYLLDDLDKAWMLITQKQSRLLAKVDEKLEDAHANLRECENHCVSLRSRLEFMQSSVEAKERQLLESNDNANKYAQQLSLLNKQVSHLQTEISVMRDEKSRMDEQSERIRSECQQELNKFEEKVAGLKKEKASRDQEYEKLVDEIKAARSALDEERASKARAEMDSASAVRELNGAKGRIGQLEAENLMLTTTSKDTERSLEALNQAKTDAELEVKQLREKSEDLLRQVDRYKSKIAQETESWEKKLDVLKENHSRSLEMEQETQESLNKQLKNVTEALEREQSANKILHGRIEALKKDAVLSEQDSKDLSISRKKLTKAEEEAARLENLLKQLKAEKTKIEEDALEEIEQLRSQMHQLQRQLGGQPTGVQDDASATRSKRIGTVRRKTKRKDGAPSFESDDETSPKRQRESVPDQSENATNVDSITDGK